jgi:Ulp1 family protease
LIDPFGVKDELLSRSYSSWVQYYLRRPDCETNKWEKMSIEHPVQTDNHSCAIFVINFIHFYIKNSKIEFSTSNMMDWRNIIAESIKKNSTA